MLIMFMEVIQMLNLVNPIIRIQMKRVIRRLFYIFNIYYITTRVLKFRKYRDLDNPFSFYFH